MADGATDWTGLMGLLGAAAIGTAGGLYNNYVNRKLQQSINADVINLANTAHQREVADLRAAGLNPILSATGNGAPVPSLGTPHQDNVLSDFGSNARAIGQAVSRQRSLENESLANSNVGQKLDNIVASRTLDTDVNSAISESLARKRQADYEAEVASDRQYALRSIKYILKDDGNGRQVSIPNPKYYNDVKDAVKADINRPWREATQSWINSGKGVADTLINAVGTGARFKSRPNPKLIRRTTRRGQTTFEYDQ